MTTSDAAYSICVPAKHGLLRIGVKVLPGGHFSGFAAGGLEVGDVLDVMTPVGRFNTPLHPANSKHYGAIAAGSGHHADPVDRRPPPWSASPAVAFTLMYANRTSRTVMFLEELEDLKDRYRDRFHLIHVLSREEQDAELFSGRLDGPRLRKICESLVPVDSVKEWFLCGPYEMVVDLREALLDEGA